MNSKTSAADTSESVCKGERGFSKINIEFQDVDAVRKMYFSFKFYPYIYMSQHFLSLRLFINIELSTYKF